MGYWTAWPMSQANIGDLPSNFIIYRSIDGTANLLVCFDEWPHGARTSQFLASLVQGYKMLAVTWYARGLEGEFESHFPTTLTSPVLCRFWNRSLCLAHLGLLS